MPALPAPHQLNVEGLGSQPGEFQPSDHPGGTWENRSVVTHAVEDVEQQPLVSPVATILDGERVVAARVVEPNLALRGLQI